MATKKTSSKKTTNNDIRIVVLQRGWVAVGIYERKGEYAVLKNASIVRKWGTDKGLGQLAERGPLKAGETQYAPTVLDPCADIEFHQLTEVLNVKCAPEKWSEACAHRV